MDQVKKLTQLFIIRGHYAQLSNETLSPKLISNYCDSTLCVFVLPKRVTTSVLVDLRSEPTSELKNLNNGRGKGTGDDGLCEMGHVTYFVLDHERDKADYEKQFEGYQHRHGVPMVIKEIGVAGGGILLKLLQTCEVPYIILFHYYN